MPSAEVTSTGTGFHLSFGIRRHRQHRVDGAAFQQALADPGCDARPLRPLARRRKRSADHATERTEEDFVGSLRIPGAAMHARFKRGIVGLDELAGLPALLGIA